MLLCASKFDTTKIGCSFEIGKYASVGVPFILLLTVQYISNFVFKHCFIQNKVIRKCHQNVYTCLRYRGLAEDANILRS